jgi:hypothetical protein
MDVYIPTVAVRDAIEEITTKAIRNSFHENTNIRRAIVNIPGLETGKMRSLGKSAVRASESSGRSVRS